jgi:hypothetical protein
MTLYLSVNLTKPWAVLPLGVLKAPSQKTMAGPSMTCIDFIACEFSDFEIAWKNSGKSGMQMVHLCLYGLRGTTPWGFLCFRN